MSTYGDVTIGETSVSIEADSVALYAWAHRPGAVWPCSVLQDLDSLSATFDSNGLLDITQEPEASTWRETGADEIPSDELNAWSSDVLRDVLPENHPCYFVTVGQFND